MPRAAVTFFGSAYLIFFFNRRGSELFTTILYDGADEYSGRRRELDNLEKNTAVSFKS
jgi:hypothetical protein